MNFSDMHGQLHVFIFFGYIKQDKNKIKSW